MFSVCRLHQSHVIDPKWCEAPEKIKTDVYSAMKHAEIFIKDDSTNVKEFDYLQVTHYNAWKGKDIQPILTGKPDFKSTGKELCIPYLVLNDHYYT